LDDPKVLWHAVKMAVSGAVTVPTSMAPNSKGLGTGARSPSLARTQDLGLTPRQLEVLRLLVQGLPNKSIANRLDIAETTARGYASELVAAFRVTNRTQLVLEFPGRTVSSERAAMPGR
jgi:DNA-binding NarL/FixJ family response regulator